MRTRVAVVVHAVVFTMVCMLVFTMVFMLVFILVSLHLLAQALTGDVILFCRDAQVLRCHGVFVCRDARVSTYARKNAQVNTYAQKPVNSTTCFVDAQEGCLLYVMLYAPCHI